MPRRVNGTKQPNGITPSASTPAVGSILRDQESRHDSRNNTMGRPPRGRSLVADRDDPEYIKEMQRPAAIQEDLSQMGRRKRVQEILESKEFLNELEEIITRQESSVDRPSIDPQYLSTLQRLSHLTLPRTSRGSSINLHGLGTSAPIIPIADLGSGAKYSLHERIYRNKLATLYRLVDLFQWSQGIYNHITVRLTEETEIAAGKPVEVLINPFGLLYHEITASSLIKIDLNGDVIDRGSTRLGVNQAGYVLHSAIHEARPDVRCVLHLHTSVVSAVSSMKCGLLPICQEAIIIGPVAYHDYQGIVSAEEEKASIVRDLGDKNVILLRNHGFVVCGESIEDALHLAFHMIIACETQIRAARAGIENLIIPDDKAIQRAYHTARQGGGGVNRLQNGNTKGSMSNSVSEGGGWKIGELEWEAWMRVLDSTGYHTGHIYRQPLLKSIYFGQQPSTSTLSDIASPPSTSALGKLNETSPEAVTAHRLALLKKEQERTRWLNSPNSYQKIEILETGTDRPKRITKWIQDYSNPESSKSTPVKIHTAHQFSPFGTDPREFKQKQRKLKEERISGTIGAGPRSQVLDSLTHEDVAFLKQSADSENVGPSDHLVIIGTASKGIIDREHQHNAMVYRSLYAPNPFSGESDEDIQRYMKEVEVKSRSRSTPALLKVNSSMSPPAQRHTLEDSSDNVSLMQAHRSLKCIEGEEQQNASKLADARSKSVTSPRSNADYTLVTVFDADGNKSPRTVHWPLSNSSKQRSDKKLAFIPILLPIRMLRPPKMGRPKRKGEASSHLQGGKSSA
ncbi:adducin-related protein 1 [Ditylenchus destructor]|uniref:Adducin-related protein 1 n=1 Tax=Ditylenchus destructor TaxID=166010 RepID=A0AAD4R856_9BILA|nr:adducin-related protein 1 [Ditylenchus destructor]